MAYGETGEGGGGEGDKYRREVGKCGYIRCDICIIYKIVNIREELNELTRESTQSRAEPDLLPKCRMEFRPLLPLRC